MKPREHDPKTPSTPTGVLALFASLFAAGRWGAAVRLLGLGFVSGLLLLSLCALPAFAAASAQVSVASPFSATLKPALANSNPPYIRSDLRRDDIHATRAEIEAEVEVEGHSVTWHCEYAESLAGPWTAAGSGMIEVGQSPLMALGVYDSTIKATVLHHLKPATKYYARFIVESEYPPASRTVEFTTLQVGKPEITHESDEARNPRADGYHSILPTTATIEVPVETNGAETKYALEYTSTPTNPSSWLPFTTDASGTISVATDFANIEAGLSGLMPETNYYVRIRVSNEYGTEDYEQEFFTTSSGRPGYGKIGMDVRNVTASSAHFNFSFANEGLETEETKWRYEYATSPSSSTWTTAAEGVVTPAQASAEIDSNVSATVEGLQPGTHYFARLSAENSYGATTSKIVEFTTSGKPVAVTFATHALHDGNVRVLGSVDPDGDKSSDEQTIAIGGAPTGGSFTLTFAGHTTTELPYDAQAQEIREALEALPGEPTIYVEGPIGGPYNISFGTREKEPQMTADGSALIPVGSSVTVQTLQEGGVGAETSYHFEYVTKAQFEAPGAQGGFTRAAATTDVDVGFGESAEIVGQDLPQLTGGEAYEYRIVATSTAPGNPVAYGATQTLFAPTPAPVEAQPPCPNAPSRVGASERLPDCRAYEQVTPVDKEGSQELFQYGNGVSNLVFVGEDGDHLALEARTIDYGSGPDAGDSPYLFSRDPGKGWQMTAGSPQPATGLALVEPALFSSDLTQLAFFSEVHTSDNEAVKSEEGSSKYEYGPFGGPYTDAASVSNSYAANKEQRVNWVGASADFSKLFLQSFDHSLSGSATSTKSGRDIYEYSAGRVRQVNVGVGSCGAEIARGEEMVAPFTSSSPHAVSSDGSRVFFEAVPGTDCSQPSQLYMRVDASRTIDIGPYRFFAANAQGTRVLLARSSGEAEEFFLYENEASTVQPKPLFTVYQPLQTNETYVSSDLSTIYFDYTGSPLTPEAPVASNQESGLYEYDVAHEKLSFIAQMDPKSRALYRFFEVSPDGRYLYFNDSVLGVPGGTAGAGEQVFLYDNAEDSIECVSCASSFAPEPKRDAELGARGDTAAETDGRGAPENGAPPVTLLSANGDFAFFDTTAALVPQDIDGEQEASNGSDANNIEFGSQEFSPSSDVYEWRRDGIAGCAQLQGCLALISSGRGGVLNMLLGSTPTGDDVFIYTKAQLTPSDVDNAGDIYDVRVDGGMPPPPPAPVECEGDACSTPPSAPNDPAQTLLPAGSPPTAVTKPSAAKKAVKCAKGKRLMHGKCVKPKTKSKHAAKRSKRAGDNRRAK